ncbi:MAG: hypothetical protein AB8G22_23550 [Saprospiraceae bacterium]
MHYLNGIIIFLIGVKHPPSLTGVTVVENAINQCLRQLGIYCHEGKDEFDSVGLGHFRSNDAVFTSIGY